MKNDMIHLLVSFDQNYISDFDMYPLPLMRQGVRAYCASDTIEARRQAL